MASKVSPSASSMSEYQSEDDHRTLTRAAEVIGDPKRMKGAKKHQRKQQKAMSLVQKTMLGGSRR